MDNNEKPLTTELPTDDLTPPTVKEKRCKAATILAITGFIAGLFIPFIGMTFALAGIYVNYAESEHYETKPGYVINVLSICLSAASWILALLLRPLIWGE